MKYEIKDEKNCTKVIEVNLDATDIEPVYKRILKNVKDNALVDGYRKGRAPEEIVKKMFEKTIHDETQKDLILDTARKILDETKLHMVVDPILGDVKSELPNNLSFKIIVEVNPVFEIKDYKGIKVQLRHFKEVTQEDINREINKIRQSRGVLKEVQKDEIKEGDYIVASIIGFIDGKPEPDLTGENELIKIGDGTILADIENGIKTMKKGEEREIKTKFPDNYFNKKFAGKDAVFRIKVKSIKELQVPEFNDEFVKSLGGPYQTKDEMIDFIKKELEKYFKQQIRIQNIEMIFNELLKDNQFEVSRSLVEMEANELLRRYENRLLSQGLSIEKLGMDRAKIREAQLKTAEENVRLRYILRKIGEVEGIEITDSDIENEIKRIAAENKEDADAMIKRAKPNWDILKAQLLEDRVIDKLLEYAEKNVNK
ncbi:MAG: trigger factor [Candidatus Goldbacteria bacterium]|nr:trigger factor [Candidatus Goldiibacteriota bacterium]